MVARAKAFDYFLKKNSGYSYYRSINDEGDGMRYYCNCIKPIEENNQYTPAVPPRGNYPAANTTATPYQPPTDEHNTQPYVPSVKPLGQNVDKHHHCDIL